VKGIDMKMEKGVYITLISAFLLILIPLVIRVPMFILSFLNMCLIYTLISQGWNMIGGYLNYYSFGHGVFFGIGAYATAILMRDYQAPLFITFPFTVLIVSIIALGIGYPGLRLRGVYFTFTTVSLNYIFMILLSLMPWAGPLGIMLPLHPFEPYFTEVIPYEVGLITVLVTVLIVYRISRSKFGLGLRAIRCDEDTAKVRGTNTTKLKLLGFIISAIPTGIAGGIYAYYTLYIDPATVFSTHISLYAIVMTLLGGAVA